MASSPLHLFIAPRGGLIHLSPGPSIFLFLFPGLFFPSFFFFFVCRAFFVPRVWSAFAGGTEFPCIKTLIFLPSPSLRSLCPEIYACPTLCGPGGCVYNGEKPSGRSAPLSRVYLPYSPRYVSHIFPPNQAEKLCPV